MATSCLVTGGSGFVGREIVRSLEEQGHEATVPGRSPVPGNTRRVLGWEPSRVLDFVRELLDGGELAPDPAALPPRGGSEP